MLLDHRRRKQRDLFFVTVAERSGRSVRWSADLKCQRRRIHQRSGAARFNYGQLVPETYARVLPPRAFKATESLSFITAAQPPPPRPHPPLSFLPVRAGGVRVGKASEQLWGAERQVYERMRARIWSSFHNKK